MQKALAILCTCPDEATAAQLGKGLLEQGLAACVNILPAVRSLYHWNGELQDDAEVLMIIKTTGTRYDPLEAWLTRHHPYDVPEVLALSAQEVSGPYLGWLREAVSE